MQCSLSIVLLLAACSRAPSVDLPVCATGVELEAGLKRSMSIDAAGRVTIDGVVCANEDEAKDALGRVMKAMHNNERLAAQLGVGYMPDEPLVVRFEQATHFADAQHWLREARYSCGIYRIRIAVRDKGSDDERCLAMDTEPVPDVPGPPCDPATAKLSGRVYIYFKTPSDVPWWNESGHTPAWYVSEHPTPCDYATWEASSWSEVRDKVLRVPGSDRDFGIDAALPESTPWRDVVAIVAEAQALLHAEIEFY